MKSRGFTLVELLVAVVIAGILFAIAIPNYSRHMVRSHRNEAQAAMMDISQREQQYLLDTRTYTNNLANLNGYTVPASVQKYYTVTVNVVAGPPPTFTITAAPKGAQVRDGSLTLNSLGVKTPSSKW